MSETLTSPIRRVSTGTVVGFLVFVELASGLLQGYYLPLIPAIRDIVGVSDADMTWFVTLQTLAAGVSVPLAVWLPLEIALIHSRIKGESARRGVGMLTAALTIGALIGGLFGGMAGTLIPSTTVVLLIPAVVLGACLVIVLTLIPESTTRATPRIDTLGFVLLAAFMLALLIGLRMAQSGGFGHVRTIVLLTVAVALLVAFILWELRVDVPAVDVRMVGSRALWPIFLTALIFGMSLFGTIVIAAFCVNGLGPGLLIGSLPAQVTELAPVDQTGIATGVYNSLRALGGAVAGAIFGAILSAFTMTGSATAGIGGYVTVWIVCAAIFAIAFLALLTQRANRTTHETSEMIA